MYWIKYLYTIKYSIYETQFDYYKQLMIYEIFLF